MLCTIHTIGNTVLGNRIAYMFTIRLGVFSFSCVIEKSRQFAKITLTYVGTFNVCV